MRKKLKALRACTLFGAAYGAVCGALYGAVFFVTVTPMVLSACCGAIGGCVSGLIGGVIGGPLGWMLAGVLGGFASKQVGGERSQKLSPAKLPTLSADLLRAGIVGPQEALTAILLLVPPILGGSLGLAVGLGIRRGASRLPGVTTLAAVLNSSHAPESASRPAASAADITPAAAPAGRGDEVAPAG